MLRGGKRGNLDKNGAVDIVKIFLNPGKTGDTEMDAEVERRVTLVSESAHQRVVFNHRDIQLTTFAPGGESSFQQKHKANRMHRLQSCTPAPCASPIRLKACCTIAKFCTNHGRSIEKSKSRWPSESVLHVFHTLRPSDSNFITLPVQWISDVFRTRSQALWKNRILNDTVYTVECTYLSFFLDRSITAGYTSTLSSFR